MTPREAAEKTHEHLTKDAEVYKGRELDTELALWTAIITLNGLLISACSVIVAMADGYWRLWFSFPIILSFYSAVLVFRNFNRRRYLYRALSKAPSVKTCEDDQLFSEFLKNLEKVLNYSKEHEKRNQEDETKAIALMALSAVGCIATVYGKLMFL